jgi:hypothetical protein
MDETLGTIFYFLFLVAHSHAALHALLASFSALCAHPLSTECWVNRTDQNMDKNAAGFTTSHLWLFAFVAMQIAPGGAASAALYAAACALRASYYVIYTQQQCSLWENISNILASPGEFLKRALNPDFRTALHNKRPR